MIEFPDESFIPISALQHFIYCPRRVALVHNERIWSDNRFTAEGNLIHEKAHSGVCEKSSNTRIVRNADIKSNTYGLIGKADVIELKRSVEPSGCTFSIPGVEGFWRPYIVEFKRGSAKQTLAYEVQVCAQVLCLEEMWNISIPESYLYYYERRHRTNIYIDSELRRLTVNSIIELRKIILSGILPKAELGKKCIICSLRDSCMPKISGMKDVSRQYVDRLFENQ